MNRVTAQTIVERILFALEEKQLFELPEDHYNQILLRETLERICLEADE